MHTNRPLVIASVMASMFMVAIEATIISTAMPQIVGELGGLTMYSWAFSIFLLAQTVATVVSGKLSDMYGRRPVMLGGIAAFLLGSLACGFAWSMESLIAFRLLQGIGAGAMQPAALTIVGDLYSAEERGRIQGFLASVWAVSALLGPVAGGFIVQHLSWPWVFWINIPVGLLATAGFVAFLHEGVTPQRRSVDYAGAALFTVAVAGLMVALTESSGQHGTVAWGAAAICAVATALFVLQERRAAEPMISFELWSRRPIAAANATTLIAGAALIGLTTFLPMFVQGVLRQTPVVAGLALTMMVLGWPTGTTLASRILRRTGLRPILLTGSVLVPIGAASFMWLSPGTPPVFAGAGSLVMGLGMGLLSFASIVLIQEIVPWSERGSATASNVFSRNLGSTLGAALYGAVLNHGLARPGAAPITSEDLQWVLAGLAAGGVEVEATRALLQQSLHATFVAVFATALLAIAAALAVPHVAIGRAAPGSAATEL